MSHSCSFLVSLNCRKDPKSHSTLRRKWVLSANLRLWYQRAHSFPQKQKKHHYWKKKKKKFIWTLVIISVWENNQGVKLSKWNSEKSRASRDLKGQKGSRKKYAGLYHGNSNEAKLKKPRQWAELLYYKLLPATGLHKSTLLSWLGNYRATRVVSDSRGSLPSIRICVNQSILVYSWEMKEKKRLKNWTVLCGLLFTDGDVWVGKTTFLLLESLTTGGWVSSHTGWFLCQLGLLAMCRR